MDDQGLVFKDVSKNFGDFVAVESFNLSIKRGEFLAIMGPSGCGICIGDSMP